VGRFLSSKPHLPAPPIAPPRVPSVAVADSSAPALPEATPVAFSGPEDQPVVFLAALAGVLLVFMKFSMLPEIQSALMGFKLYLLYLAAIPGCFAILVSGGVKRTFKGGPAAYCWLGYMLWIMLATPFSSWRGDSVHMVNMALKNIPMVFVCAGLAVNWRFCKWMMYAIAGGGVVNLIASRVFMKDFGGRSGLEFGTVSNPNDFAGHLLLVLPFLLWIVLSSKPMVLRLGALAAVVFGVYLILGTASRGALVALVGGLLLFLWKGSAKQRIAVLVIVPMLAGVVLMVMPHTVLSRLSSFSAGDSNSEALESSDSRRYLLKKSIEYTFQFPLFGVGPGQFGNYEGGHNQVIGTHGMYHGAHNSYTQASAECGIPALLFFVAGIVSAFHILNSTFKEARRRPECEDITTAAFCFMLAMVGFCIAIFFLNFAYFYYLPTMGGLAVAVRRAAKQEFQTRRQFAVAGGGEL